MGIDPFERVQLGRAPVHVWRFGLGLAALSGLFRAVTDEEAATVLDRAWDVGVRYYDTAPLLRPSAVSASRAPMARCSSEPVAIRMSSGAVTEPSAVVASAST